MEKSYRFRIYPNAKQRELIAKTFGCTRFVYNYYLDKKIKLYEASKQSFGYNACCSDLTLLKKETIIVVTKTFIAYMRTRTVIAV